MDEKTEAKDGQPSDKQQTPPAEKKDSSAKRVKGWFKAKEDCFLEGTHGLKREGSVFPYEGTAHDSLVPTKAPTQEE